MSGPFNIRQNGAVLPSDSSSSDMDMDSECEIDAIGDLLLSEKPDVKPDVNQLRANTGMPTPMFTSMQTATYDQSTQQNANRNETATSNLVTRESLQAALDYVNVAMLQKKAIPNTTAASLLDQPSTSSGMYRTNANVSTPNAAPLQHQQYTIVTSQNTMPNGLINFDSNIDYSEPLNEEIEISDETYNDEWMMTEFEREGVCIETNNEMIEQYNQNAPPIFRIILQQMEDEQNNTATTVGITSPLASPTEPPTQSTSDTSEPRGIFQILTTPPILPQPQKHQIPCFPVPPPTIFNPVQRFPFVNPVPLPMPSHSFVNPVPPPIVNQTFGNPFGSLQLTSQGYSPELLNACEEIFKSLMNNQSVNNQLPTPNNNRDPRLDDQKSTMPNKFSGKFGCGTIKVDRSDLPNVKDARMESTATIYRKPIKYACEKPNRFPPIELHCFNRDEWAKAHTPPLTENENIENAVGPDCGEPLGRQPINYSNSPFGSTSRNSSPQFSDPESSVSNPAPVQFPSKQLQTINASENVAELEEAADAYAPKIPATRISFTNRRISINPTEPCAIPGIDDSDNDSSCSNVTIEFPYNVNEVLKMVEKGKAVKETGGGQSDVPIAKTAAESAEPTVTAPAEQEPNSDGKKRDDTKSTKEKTEKTGHQSFKKDKPRSQNQQRVNTRNSIKTPPTDKSKKQKSAEESSASSNSTRRKKLSRTRSSGPKRSISASSASEPEKETSSSGQSARKLRSTTKKRRTIEKTPPEPKTKPTTRSSQRKLHLPLPMTIKSEPKEPTAMDYSDSEKILPVTSDDNQIVSPDSEHSNGMSFRILPIEEYTFSPVKTATVPPIQPNEITDGNIATEELMPDHSVVSSTDDLQQNVQSVAEPSSSVNQNTSSAINADIEMTKTDSIPDVGAEIKIEEPPIEAHRNSLIELPNHATDEQYTLSSDEEDRLTEFAYASGSESAATSSRPKSTDEDVSFNDPTDNTEANVNISVLATEMELNDDNGDELINELNIQEPSVNLAVVSNISRSLVEINLSRANELQIPNTLPDDIFDDRTADSVEITEPLHTSINATPPMSVIKPAASKNNQDKCDADADDNAVPSSGPTDLKSSSNNEPAIVSNENEVNNTETGAGISSSVPNKTCDSSHQPDASKTIQNENTAGASSTAHNDSTEDVKDIKPDVSQLPIMSPHQAGLLKLVQARRNQGIGQRRLADIVKGPGVCPAVVDLVDLDTDSGNDTDKTVDFDESKIRSPGKFR